MHDQRTTARNRARLFASALGLALLMPTAAFAADPKIDLYVDGGKLRFGNSECPSEPGLMGCVEVGAGSKNWIQWELAQNDWQDGWQLSGLQLSWDGSVPVDCVVRDFNVDPGSGWANDFQVQGNGKWARNWDENDCEQSYVVNYRVYARNQNTGEEANSDPIIKNGGRR